MHNDENVFTTFADDQQNC